MAYKDFDLKDFVYSSHDNYEKRAYDKYIDDSLNINKDIDLQERADDPYRQTTSTWGKIKRLASVSHKHFLSIVRRLETTYAQDILLGPAKGLQYLGKEFIVDPIVAAGKAGEQFLHATTERYIGSRRMEELGIRDSLLEQDLTKAMGEGKQGEFERNFIANVGSAAPGGRWAKGLTFGTKAATQASIAGLKEAGLKGIFKPGAASKAPTIFADALKKFTLPERWFGSKFIRNAIVRPVNKIAIHPLTGIPTKGGVLGRGVVGSALWTAEKGLGRIAGMPFNKFITDPLGKTALKTAWAAELGIKNGDFMGMGKGGTEDQKRLAELASQPLPPKEARLIANPLINLIEDIGVGSAIGIPHLEAIGDAAARLKKFKKGVGQVHIDRYLESWGPRASKLIDQYRAKNYVRGQIAGQLEELKAPVNPNTIENWNQHTITKTGEIETGNFANSKYQGVYRDVETGAEFSGEEKAKHMLLYVFEGPQGPTTKELLNTRFAKMEAKLLDEIPVGGYPKAFGYTEGNPSAFATNRVRKTPRLGETTTRTQEAAATFMEKPIGEYLLGNRADTEIYRDTLDIFKKKIVGHEVFGKSEKTPDDLLQVIETMYRDTPQFKVNNLNLSAKATIQDLAQKDWEAIVDKMNFTKDKKQVIIMAKELRGMARQSFADISAKFVGMKPWLMNQMKKSNVVNTASVYGRMGRFSLRGTFHTQQLFEDLPYIAMDAKNIRDPKVRNAFTSVGYQGYDAYIDELGDLGRVDNFENMLQGRATGRIGSFEAIGESTKGSSMLKYERIKRTKAVSTRWVAEMAEKLEDMPAIKAIMEKNGYKNLSDIPEIGNMFDDIAKNPSKVDKYIESFGLKQIPGEGLVYLAKEAKRYKSADEFVKKSGIIPEWGTQNQYYSRNPYKIKMDEMLKTKNWDISVLKDAERWEMKQLLKDKPSFLSENLSNKEVRKFAKDNNLLIEKEESGKLIVAKNKENLSAVLNAKNQRDLGLALGYKDIGVMGNGKSRLAKSQLIDFYNQAVKTPTPGVTKIVPGLTDQGIRWTGKDVTDALFEANRTAKKTAQETARPYFLYNPRASGIERDLHSVLFPYRYTKKVVGNIGKFATSGSTARPIVMKKGYELHDQVLTDFKKDEPELFDKLYGWGEDKTIPEAALSHFLDLTYSALPLDMRYGDISVGSPQPILNASVQYAFDKLEESNGKEIYSQWDVNTLTDAAMGVMKNWVGLDPATAEYKLIQNYIRKYVLRWE